jgi:hypothetical protein
LAEFDDRSGYKTPPLMTVNARPNDRVVDKESVEKDLVED